MLKYPLSTVVRPRNPSLPVLVALGIMSCRPAPETSPASVEPTPKRAEPVTESVPASSSPALSDLIPEIVLVPPASIVVELEFFDEVCEREGFPETLSNEAAAELGDAKPGSPVTIVHTEGQTTVQVESAGCQEAEEYVAESATLLILDQPAGPEAPGSRVERMMAAPYLGFVGTSPVPEARLDAPPGVAWDSAFGERVRGQVAALVSEMVATRTKQCRTQIDEGNIRAPSVEAIQAAVQRVEAWQLAASPPVVWMEFGDPAITFSCYEDYVDTVGVLLDVESGAKLLTVESNNGVELRWVTDLDGDGAKEGLVDVQWLEDGGHKIILLARGESGWAETRLYEFDGP